MPLKMKSDMDTSSLMKTTHERSNKIENPTNSRFSEEAKMFKNLT